MPALQGQFPVIVFPGALVLESVSGKLKALLVLASSPQPQLAAPTAPGKACETLEIGLLDFLLTRIEPDLKQGIVAEVQ
jgi:hypothetical protein